MVLRFFIRDVSAISVLKIAYLKVILFQRVHELLAPHNPIGTEADNPFAQSLSNTLIESFVNAAERSYRSFLAEESMLDMDMVRQRERTTDPTDFFCKKDDGDDLNEVERQKIAVVEDVTMRAGGTPEMARTIVQDGMDRLIVCVVSVADWLLFRTKNDARGRCRSRYPYQMLIERETHHKSDAS